MLQRVAADPAFQPRVHLMVEAFEEDGCGIQPSGGVNAVCVRVARRYASRRDQRSADEARLHRQVGHQISGGGPVKHGAGTDRRERNE